MIDPIQLPILMKAIDFIFDEGRKILEERRERRKLSDTSSKSEDQESAEEPALPEPEKANEIKQDLLTSKIDELLWQTHKDEIESLVKQLESHSTNYHLAREQYAKWGSELVPAIVVHRMTDAENRMIETKKELENVLSKVYKINILSGK